jgi:hypothetical protein
MHKFIITAEMTLSFLKEQRKDPVTGDLFVLGDEIVFCKTCSSAFLSSSWEYMGEKHCGQTQTLDKFPLSSTALQIDKKSNFILKLPNKINSFFADVLLITAILLLNFIFLFVCLAADAFVPFILGIIATPFVSIASFYAFRNIFTDFDGIHFIEVFSDGIYRNNRLQAKLLVKKSDLSQVFFLILLKDNKSSNAGINFTIATTDVHHQIQVLQTLSFDDFDALPVPDVIEKMLKFSRICPVSLITQSWYFGKYIAEEITQMSKFPIKVNDLTTIHLLKKAGMDFRSNLVNYGKIYYTDLPNFAFLGSLLDYTAYAQINQKNDALVLSENGLWTKFSRQEISPDNIQRIRFIETFHGFRIMVRENDSEKEELIYTFIGSEALNFHQVYCLNGLKEFCRDYNILFKFETD